MPPDSGNPAGERYLLLVNPSAGNGRSQDRLPRARRALDGHGASYRVEMTEGLDHGVEMATAAAAEGEIPVVMSGDGLIGKIGGALAGTETPLGILPGGRGNDLARVLGIPVDPEEAVEILVAGERRRIDVGVANGVRFLCIASCGFDSDANRIANEAKLIRGAPVYAYAAIRALIQWKPAQFEVVADGERYSYRGFAVAVANSKAYGGGMFVAPQAELDDGRLDVVMTEGSGRLRFLRNLPKVFEGDHLGTEEVSTARARVVELSADRDFDVYADGECITSLPARIEILPSALTVIAPEDR